MEVWSQWSPAFWPVAWLLVSMFAARLKQLSLPLRPLETSRGMDSEVIQVLSPEGDLLGTAWMRTLRSSGATVYGGWYGVVETNGRKLVRVVFPLPNGSLTVLLRPESTGGGALRLVSPVGSFGDAGAYLVVKKRGTRIAWVRRIPVAEQFDVYVDNERVLRTDHVVKLFGFEILRLHYRLEPRPLSSQTNPR